MVKFIVLLAVLFRLGMTESQARTKCPRVLIPMYTMLHESKYLACDDGKDTTVLVFYKGSLVSIMDLRWFVQHGGG